MNIILKYIVTLAIFTIFTVPTYAASFSILPNSGTVIKDREFTTDIMINTLGETAVLARSVLTFNPSVIKVLKAEHNASLFCSYPEGLQGVDNSDGLIIITGFCQSGNGIGYKTVGDADVFARITYSVVGLGDADIKWEYTGIDEEFKSIIMKDGSPTTSILTQTPKDAKFLAKDSNNIYVPPPVTAIGESISWTFIVIGIILVFLGIIFTTVSLKFGKRGIRTLIQDE